MHMALEYSKTIPVTLIKEMMWCPVIPWIIRNYGIEPPYTPSMEVGIEVQRRLDLEKISEELQLPKPIRASVYVEDKALGLHGVVDIIAGKKRLHVVEVKAFKRRVKYSKHFITQLKVYAVMVYRVLGPVERAHLYMNGVTHSITVREQAFLEVKQVVEKLWRIVSSPEPPQVVKVLEKCSYCRYRRFCPIV